jgi:hypothetical protein
MNSEIKERKNLNMFRGKRKKQEDLLMLLTIGLTNKILEKHVDPSFVPQKLQGTYKKTKINAGNSHLIISAKFNEIKDPGLSKSVAHDTDKGIRWGADVTQSGYKKIPKSEVTGRHEPSQSQNEIGSLRTKRNPRNYPLANVLDSFKRGSVSVMNKKLLFDENVSVSGESEGGERIILGKAENSSAKDTSKRSIWEIAREDVEKYRMEESRIQKKMSDLMEYAANLEKEYQESLSIGRRASAMPTIGPPPEPSREANSRTGSKPGSRQRLGSKRQGRRDSTIIGLVNGKRMSGPDDTESIRKDSGAEEKVIVRRRQLIMDSFVAPELVSTPKKNPNLAHLN